MDNQRLIEALDRVGEIFADLAQDIRDNRVNEAPDYNDGPDEVPQAAQVGREVPDDDNRGNDATVEVPAGDLWRLVNRSRKMIRLAREGKIPNMEARMPLNLAIRKLKAQGVIRKPA